MNKKQLSQLAAELGRKGGKKGTGAKKRRDPEHYALMVKKRNKQRAHARRLKEAKK
jgi:general stress protein YciG